MSDSSLGVVIPSSRRDVIVELLYKLMQYKVDQIILVATYTDKDIKDFCHKHKIEFIYFNHVNEQHYARFIGAMCCSTTYVHLLDDDDLPSKSFYENIFESGYLYYCPNTLGKKDKCYRFFNSHRAQLGSINISCMVYDRRKLLDTFMSFNVKVDSINEPFLINLKYLDLVKPKVKKLNGFVIRGLDDNTYKTPREGNYSNCYTYWLTIPKYIKTNDTLFNEHLKIEYRRQESWFNRVQNKELKQWANQKEFRR